VRIVKLTLTSGILIVFLLLPDSDSDGSNSALDRDLFADSRLSAFFVVTENVSVSLLPAPPRAGCSLMTFCCVSGGMHGGASGDAGSSGDEQDSAEVGEAIDEEEDGTSSGQESVGAMSLRDGKAGIGMFAGGATSGEDLIVSDVVVVFVVTVTVSAVGADVCCGSAGGCSTDD
jgi:hypothetical protein